MDPGDAPIRILVADQHGLFREALRTGLETEQDLVVVAEARNGPEAVAEIERTVPHVAIVDMDLPVTDAASTTRLIKERTNSCRVLILGGTEDYRRLVDVLDAGANGYVTKEAPLADLIHATRAVHRGDTLISPRILGPLLATLLRRKRELDRAHVRISRLTRREREVLALLADGADNDSIARRLVISPQTARTHIQNILTKLSVHSRLEAAAFVTQNGILEDLVLVDV
ncbi:MAG TPA: response regulator transcription factor [Actinomycetota bacterium]|nr:response regulator transcription factor [Actinomycetota bacterium]